MFITQPSNIDYLLDTLRYRLGDFTGTVYSTTLLRTALVNGVKFLQKRWNSKYQVFTAQTKLIPQPSDIPDGYIRISSVHGDATILDNRGDGTSYVENDIFRNPFTVFDQTSGLFLQVDEDAVVLAGLYLTHIAKLTGTADSFVSWRTEDISYSNLGGERARQVLLSQITEELNTLFRTKIAQPVISSFPVVDPFGTKVY